MLENACIVQAALYRVTLTGDGAYFAFIDAKGLDFLFFVTLRPDQGTMVVNDRINGIWGKELEFSLPPKSHPERSNFEFKFNGETMEVWNAAAAVEFKRFDKRRAEGTKFLRLVDSDTNEHALRMSFGGLENALAKIDSHLINKRLDHLESMLAGTGRNETVALDQAET